MLISSTFLDFVSAGLCSAWGADSAGNNQQQGQNRTRVSPRRWGRSAFASCAICHLICWTCSVLTISASFMDLAFRYVVEFCTSFVHFQCSLSDVMLCFLTAISLFCRQKLVPPKPLLPPGWEPANPPKAQYKRVSIYVSLFVFVSILLKFNVVCKTSYFLVSDWRCHDFIVIIVILFWLFAQVGLVRVNHLLFYRIGDLSPIGEYTLVIAAISSLLCWFGYLLIPCVFPSVKSLEPPLKPMLIPPK